MTTTSSRARLGLGVLVGLGLWGAWRASVGVPLPGWHEVRPGWVACGLASVAGTVALQVARSRWLFPEVAVARVGGVVLLAHGLNTAFALSGDVAELTWLVTGSGLPRGVAALRVLYRALGTVLGSVAAIGLAVGPAGVGVSALAALAVGLGGFVGWRQGWLPDRRSVALHAAGLAAQVALAAFAVRCAGLAVGAPTSWGVAFSASGVVDLLSYVPLPGGTLGLHHLAFTWATTHAGAAALHHGLTVVVGALALVAGHLVLRGESR